MTSRLPTFGKSIVLPINKKKPPNQKFEREGFLFHGNLYYGPKI